ncbi:UNVERIFIED_CONTAM: hypothetical protein RMT77_007976 [Armadillidium vulgare]
MIFFLSLAFLMSALSPSMAEDLQMQEMNDVEGNREAKLLFSDGNTFSKQLFGLPDTQKSSPDSEMQARFFKVVHSSNSITPLETLINTVKRVIPRCIDNIDRILESYERYVRNNEGVIPFDPRIITDQFQQITFIANQILSDAIRNINSPGPATQNPTAAPGTGIVPDLPVGGGALPELPVGGGALPNLPVG